MYWTMKMDPAEIKKFYFSNSSFTPSCDVEENDDLYLVSIDVPGMNKDGLKIEIKGNKMMVSGERRKDPAMDTSSERKTGHWERSFGSFQRVFNLPADVDHEKMEAHCQDGVLQILIPKADSSRARIIPIKNATA